MSLLPDVNPITTGRAVRAVGLVGAVTLALSACAGEKNFVPGSVFHTV